MSKHMCTKTQRVWSVLSIREKHTLTSLSRIPPQVITATIRSYEIIAYFFYFEPFEDLPK